MFMDLTFEKHHKISTLKFNKLWKTLLNGLTLVAFDKMLLMSSSRLNPIEILIQGVKYKVKQKSLTEFDEWSSLSLLDEHILRILVVK